MRNTGDPLSGSIIPEVIGSQVSAFDTAHLRKLKDTNDCIACDLRGGLSLRMRN